MVSKPLKGGAAPYNPRSCRRGHNVATHKGHNYPISGEKITWVPLESVLPNKRFLIHALMIQTKSEELVWLTGTFQQIRPILLLLNLE